MSSQWTWSYTGEGRGGEPTEDEVQRAFDKAITGDAPSGGSEEVKALEGTTFVKSNAYPDIPSGLHINSQVQWS